MKRDGPLPITNGPLDYPRPTKANSVGGTPSDQKRQEAENFVKRLRKEKAEREQNLKFMTDAKDNMFLKKLQDTLDIRKKMDSIKQREKEMQHNHMLKKLE
jgi:hypothetical protein